MEIKTFAEISLVKLWDGDCKWKLVNTLEGWAWERRGAEAGSQSTSNSFIIRRSQQVTLTIPHRQIQMVYCQTLWQDMTKGKLDQILRKMQKMNDTLIFCLCISHKPSVAVTLCTLHLCKIVWRMKSCEPTNYDVWSLSLARITSLNGMIKDLIFNTSQNRSSFYII